MLPDDLVVQDDQRGMLSLLAMLGPESPAVRAADALIGSSGPILLCTGFPVGGRSETDGPAGAIMLGRALGALQKEPVVVSWHAAIEAWRLALGPLPHIEIAQGAPSPRLRGTLVTIETPGRLPDGSYANMRGENIATQSPWFEDAIGSHARISIGDGGNEFGMGSAPAAWFEGRSVKRPVSTCDILVVGQVSNWGALSIVAALSRRTRQELLPAPDGYQSLLEELAAGGSVDGVTGGLTPTEDGFVAGAGALVVERLTRWAGA